MILLAIYLAINALFLHFIILIVELLKPSFTSALMYRRADEMKYWVTLVVIAFLYRVVKGAIKRGLGISDE